MEVKQVAALPKQLAVMDIEMSDDVLTITTLSTQACPCCPLCGKPSARIHSRYLRQVADLPCGGWQVRLLVQVRKCFCETPDCIRKIFVERLTPFVTPFARVTQRLFQIVQVIGLATGGRLGVRVTEVSRSLKQGTSVMASSRKQRDMCCTISRFSEAATEGKRIAASRCVRKNDFT